MPNSVANDPGPHNFLGETVRVKRLAIFHDPSPQTHRHDMMEVVSDRQLVLTRSSGDIHLTATS
jgi:hypothetical protein